MGLMIHCGGRRLSELELAQIPTPEKTSTYTPIPFIDLIELTKQRIVREFGSGTQLDVALGVNGPETQMFGVITVLDGDKIMPNVGLRSSHDKSIAPGIVAGGSLTVCDNLLFNGDFLKIMRKHTGDAWSDLELLIMGGIAKLESHFDVIHNEASAFEDVELTKTEGWWQLGELMGSGVLTSVQTNEAMRYWNKPVVPEYQKENAWAFYNACTYGLKKGNPGKLMGQYTQLHTHMRDRWLNDYVPSQMGDVADAELVEMAEAV